MVMIMPPSTSASNFSPSSIHPREGYFFECESHIFTASPILCHRVIHRVITNSQTISWSGNMQDYKEIDRVRKDSVAVKSLAKRLLSIPNHDWNDWELDFLEHMVRHRGPEPITTRQGEKLIELRDYSEYHSSVQGFSVASLITNCWLARDDLKDEEDRNFIDNLKASDASALRRRHLGKLLACARQVGAVEKYIAIET
jgi:hypothetical protein